MVVGTVLSELILLCSMNIVCGLLKHFFFHSSWGESWGEQVSLIFFFPDRRQEPKRTTQYFSCRFYISWLFTRVTHHSRDTPLAWLTTRVRLAVASCLTLSPEASVSHATGTVVGNLTNLNLLMSFATGILLDISWRWQLWFEHHVYLGRRWLSNSQVRWYACKWNILNIHWT